MPNRPPSTRLIVALALTLSLAALTACGGGGGKRDDTERGGDAPKRGGTLTMLFQGDVDSIDAGVTYYNAGYIVAIVTQRALLSFKAPDATRPIPDLAESLPQVSADGRTVTVRIRAGIRFSPPVSREVTADDVRYAIERGFFRTVDNPYATLYFGDVEGAEEGVAPGTRIRGIETPDRQTLVFRLKRATGGVLAGAMVLPMTAPVPAAEAARWDEKSPSRYGEHQSATGPYMFEEAADGSVTGYTAGERIRLVRNPSWRAATDFRPAYVDAVDIREGNTDTAVATQKVLVGHGMVTGEWAVPGPALRRAVSSRRDQLEFPASGGFDWITLNTAIPPFDDLDVRRAVVAGADRNALRLAEGGALLGPFATHFIPPGTPGHDEAGGAAGPGLDFLADPKGDMDLAAGYLRKAGFASGRYGGRDEVVVAEGNDPKNQRLGEVFAAGLERLGFKVKLRPIASDALYTRCGAPSAKLNACVGLGWLRDFADPQTVLLPTLGGMSILPQGNPNQAQLDVPAINAAMRRATATVGEDERARAWAAIDRQATAQAPAVPLTWNRQPMARSADVRAVPNVQALGWDIASASVR